MVHAKAKMKAQQWGNWWEDEMVLPMGKAWDPSWARSKVQQWELAKGKAWDPSRAPARVFP